MSLPKNTDRVSVFAWSFIVCYTLVTVVATSNSAPVDTLSVRPEFFTENRIERSAQKIPSGLNNTSCLTSKR